MAGIAFFDLTGDTGQVLLFDRGSRKLKDSIPFELDETHALRVGSLPRDVEEAYLSLPPGMLNYRVLELPLMDMDKVKDVLPFELEGIILESAQSVVFDALPLERTEEGQKVLAVYLEKATLQGLLRQMKALGADPKAVTSIDLGVALETYAASGGELSSLLLERPLAVEEERVERARKEMDAPTVNLRTGELSYTRETERTRRSLRLTAAACILLVLLFIGDIFLRTAATNREAARLQSAILQSYSAVFPGEKPRSAGGLSSKVKSRLKELENQIAFMSGVSPLEFLLELQGRNVPGLRFTEMTLARDLIVLKGEASSLSTVQQIKERLEGLLTEVNISDTEQTVRDNITFTITARGGRA